MARREAKICLWPASWARKLNCVQRIPTAAAINSWYQDSPIKANPNQVPAIRSTKATKTQM
ncbi:hypothetical protein D3C86_2165390 [compost metagenome]